MSRKQRRDAQETRERLLAAAVEVFAQKGFWETTHAEICEKAKANIAAVNYHFGSKENLYVEAWKHAFEESIQAHPPDGGVPANAPVAERLHGHVLALMHRTADPGNHEIEIMHREMANPTGLLGDAIRRVLEPMRQATVSLVRELLGDGVGEQQVQFCEMSLISQCFGPMLRMRRDRKAFGPPHPGGPPVHFTVEELADHVVRFSLAGIRGVREESQGHKKSGRRPK
ncbi:MAG: CerR family C-terminal domain-containing protein [Phycisphaerales bacterium]